MVLQRTFRRQQSYRRKPYKKELTQYVSVLDETTETRLVWLLDENQTHRTVKLFMHVKSMYRVYGEICMMGMAQIMYHNFICIT